MNRVLIVEDEASMREMLSIMLRDAGYEVDTAATAAEADRALAAEDFGVVLTDLRLGRDSGLDVLERVKHVQPAAEVILITAFATTESAIRAMKAGAYDYVTKPFKLEETRILIGKAFEKHALVRERARLQQELERRYRFDRFVGASRAMEAVYDLIDKVSSTKTNVLVCGESGTGKELVARAIHYASPRRERPFVAINCGAVPETLFESELFGHTKGAFTGAVGSKDGLFERAHGGTMFLDEIGEVPPAVQVKLLRALSERTFTRVGGLDPITVDVRVIAATNRDLQSEVKAGRFREDLYYRLNVIRIDMPPLRERVDDVPLLAQHFLTKFAAEFGKPVRGFAPEVMECLQAHAWPGNVRELENVIERAVTLESAEVVGLATLPRELLRRGASAATSATSGGAVESVVVEVPDTGMSIEATLEGYERKLLLEALRKAHGVRTRAAELVGLSFRQFRYRVEKLAITDAEIAASRSAKG